MLIIIFLYPTTVGNNNRDPFSENVPVLPTLLVANSVCKSGEGEVCVPSKYLPTFYSLSIPTLYITVTNTILNCYYSIRNLRKWLTLQCNKFKLFNLNYNRLSTIVSNYCTYIQIVYTIAFHLSRTSRETHKLS